MVLFSLQDKYFSRVYGEEEDFSACKMIRIGRLIQPVESQDIGVITLGCAALDGLETRKKNQTSEKTFSDAEQRKRTLAAHREPIMESRSEKYK